MNEGKRKPIYNSTNSQAAMASHILLIRWTCKAHFLRYLRVAVRVSVVPGTSIVSAEIYLFTLRFDSDWTVCDTMHINLIELSPRKQ